MKISIIIPTYNRSEHLEQIILSVLEQSYSNKELIIIDGGSTDDTLDVIKKYSDRIYYWESKTDYGQFHAVNKGILRSTGDIIGFIGSDDIYKENAFAKVVKTFYQNQNCSLVYGEAELIDDNGDYIGKYNAKQTNLKELSSVRCFVPCQSAFFKKEILARIGLYSLNYRWSSDWELWLRIFKNSEAVFINDVLGAWRINRHDGFTFKPNNKEYLLYLESIKISFKYSRNIFTKLIRANVKNIFIYFIKKILHVFQKK